MATNYSRHAMRFSSSSVLLLWCGLLLSLTPTYSSSSMVQDPELVVQEVNEKISNGTGRKPLCGSGNPIDDCWRCDPHWASKRKHLADCAIGFGKGAIGGRDGNIYVVTDPSDDNPAHPKPGTLRYGAIQEKPLWIIFKGDMEIKLKNELFLTSFKTLDGRGARVHITGRGPCIAIHKVNNIIIHGLHIHDCKRGGNGYVTDKPNHIEKEDESDGDGVSIFEGRHVWVDHCTLFRCEDGLIDAIHGSTAITLSNNLMTHQNKVMLLGHDDKYVQDKGMQVTVAFNHFGEGLVQRMPRCRLGFFHVVNNDYTHWMMYAIGGSANPTIISQGNRYLAPNDKGNKEVAKRLDTDPRVWKHWSWRSKDDLKLNGAVFTQSGKDIPSPIYSSFSGNSSRVVESITRGAGALNCVTGRICQYFLHI